MKIVGIAVWLECENCHGKKQVPGGQLQYGETIACPVCGGKGTVLGCSPLLDDAGQWVQRGWGR